MRFSRISSGYLRRKPFSFAKRRSGRANSTTEKQALFLIVFVIALFSIAYLLTFWLRAN
jgi:hypothetical protein